jgi:long-subunit acyl-CoA synthetase (AMP-forming)
VGPAGACPNAGRPRCATADTPRSRSARSTASRRPRASFRWAGVDRANARLARVEQIKRFAILTEEWLPDSDELTPTMKLKRRPITEKYASQIEALYTTKETK